MTSTFETGHVKIVANFDRLIESVAKLGKDYNPSNPAILIEALQNASKNCKAALDAVGTAALVYKQAIKQREMVFDPLNKLSTRIFNTLKASDKSGKSDETARIYVRKIQGRRATAKRTEDEKKADLESGIKYNEVSASQMSFDNRIENFAMLVKLVSGVPSYSPNEADLKADSLKALLETLRQKNMAVVSATSDLFKARAIRNELLYKEATGIADKAIDAKTYLKGAFGPSSTQYKEVSGLSFKKVSRN